MPQTHLTNKTIRALPSPEAGTIWYYDTKDSGFSLAVGTRKRTFYLSRSLNGKNIRMRLGEFDAVSADAARLAARQHTADISRGVDPRATIAREKAAKEEAVRAAAVTTLQDVLDDYIDTYTHASHDRLSLDTADQYRRVLKNHCRDWLARDVHLITNADVKELHRSLRETPHIANQLIRVLRSLLRHMEIPVPPKFKWFKKGERKMDIIDLALFREQVLSVQNASRRAVWLLAVHTGIRRQNLLELEWENVDLDAKTLYLSKMKNGLDRTMPLSDQAVGVIRSMADLHKRWVFPSFDGGEHLVEVRDPLVPYIFHNTRRVFTEACASCLLPRYAISYLRGDKGQTIEEHYMTTLDLTDAIKRVGDYIEAKMMPRPELKAAA